MSSSDASTAHTGTLTCIAGRR